MIFCCLVFLSLLSLARFEDNNLLSFEDYSAEYLSSTITEEQRLQFYSVWKKNVEHINEHNSKTDSSFKLGINEFTHLVCTI